MTAKKKPLDDDEPEPLAGEMCRDIAVDEDLDDGTAIRRQLALLSDQLDMMIGLNIYILEALELRTEKKH